MSVSSHALRDGLDSAMEAIAEDWFQQKALFNPDRKINSLGERVITLDRYGVPEDVIRALIADVGAVLKSIDRALAYQREVAGVLDESARLAHNAERNGRVAEALTAKSLARALRPHLRALAADPGAIDARRAVDRLVANEPTAKLRGKSLRHELGRPPHELHELLCRLIEQREHATTGTPDREEQTA